MEILQVKRIQFESFNHFIFIVKDLANTPCIPIVGCLSDQVKENIDRISCVVDKEINKWSDKLILKNPTKDATYPNCEIGTNSTEWEKYIDDLFIEVSS